MRYAKLCIVAEEIDETVFWIEFIIDAHIVDTSALMALLPEAVEILKIISTYKKTQKPGL